MMKDGETARTLFHPPAKPLDVTSLTQKFQIFANVACKELLKTIALQMAERNSLPNHFVFFNRIPIESW